MTEYILRLDDACEQRNIIGWKKIENLLDTYGVKPLVGIIPYCEDFQMKQYPRDENFWGLARQWMDKGWTIAMHGYNHVYITEAGGMNPVNRYSEFAGVSYEEQAEKVRKGISVFRQHGFCPKVFFAPAHTFDENTLKALEVESEIRIISDTIAWKPYRKGVFTFVPQQSGKVRRLPFRIVTFCYHPNTMREQDFIELEAFLRNYSKRFISFPMKQSNRMVSILDKVLSGMYLRKHRKQQNKMLKESEI